jgi:hypothetical protein
LGRFDTAETDRVAELLEKAGFGVAGCTRHDAKNPDLRVDGPVQFWAEVKGLADSPQIRGFELAREYLAPRMKELPCAVDLYISEQAKHYEYKLLYQLIKQSLSDRRWPSFALLSDGYIPNVVHSYTLEFRSGQNVSILAYLNHNRQIVAPWQIDSPVFGQAFDLKTGKELQNQKLRNYAEEFLVGAHLYQHASYSGLVGTTHTRGMWKSTSQPRFRRDVAKANKQISAACKLEDLPGVVFLVGYGSRTAFVCALLGDAMIAVPSGTDETARAYYGRNGAFRRDRNTHISAAYLLNGEDIYFLANPFSRHKIESVLPQAQIISIDEKGYVIGA